MKRYKFGVDHSPKKKFDIEDPDQRPISLIHAYVASKLNRRSKSCFRTVKPQSNTNTSNRPTPVRSKKQINSIQPVDFQMPESDLPIEDEFSTFNFDTTLTPTCVPKIPLRMLSFLGAAKKYDTQPTSPIHKKFKVFDQKNSYINDKVINPTDFIQNFVYQKTSEDKAKIIQSAFRKHEKKRRIQIAFDNQLRISKNILRVCFLNWILVHETDPIKLETIFNQILCFSKSLHLIPRNTFQSVELPVFYKTEFIFIPNFLEMEQFYQIHFLLNRFTYRKVLKSWILITKRRNQFRTKHHSLLFTIKKWGNYGYIYQVFQLWYRYSQWKKLERINHMKIELTNQFHEVNVLWNLLERSFYRRRAKIVRAMNHSKEKIKLRAYHAFHNLLIQKNARKQIYKESAVYYSKHVQKYAYSAWIKYKQNKEHESLLLRESFRGWYSCVYSAAKKALMFDLSTIQFRKNKMIKILSFWHRITDRQKLNDLHLMLNVQAHPAQSMLVTFLLLNEFDIFYFIFSFRMWIRVVRARKRWKTFCAWASQVNPEIELKQITLTEFKRIAKLKLISRKYSSPGSFFPRETFFSFELTFREFITQKIEENREKQNKKWHYLTELPKPSNFEIQNKNEILIRCALLYLNKLKKFHQIQSLEIIHPSNPFFQKCRSLDELKHSVIDNTTIFRNRVVKKIKSYKILLNQMVTHISALQIQKTIPEFTTDNLYSAYNECNDCDYLNECKELITFPDIDESMHEIKKNFEKYQPNSNFDLNVIKVQAYAQFTRKLRNPQNVFVSSESSSELSSNLDLFRNQSTNTLSIQPISFWSIDNFCRILEAFGTFESMTNSLLHFFRGSTIFIPTILYNDAIEVVGKTSPVVSIKMPDLICPNVKQSKRHKMVNNLKFFLAQMAGRKDLTKVPRRVKTESYVAAAVDAILTVHAAIADTSLSQYCDEIPFSSRIEFTDKLVLETYTRLWEAIRSKYPNVSLHIENNEPKEIEVVVEPSIEASSVVSIESIQTKPSHEKTTKTTFGPVPLTSNEAILSCFLLPFIISFDVIKEFAKDELIEKAEK